MLGLAHSGARIIVADDSVIKIGPGTYNQAKYMVHLSCNRTPAIYSSWPDGYAMEKLDEPDLSTTEHIRTLLHMAKLALEKEFWCRAPTQTIGFASWKLELDAWAEDYPWLQGMVHRLYNFADPMRECLIHGDPTLANCMKRDNKLVFIDPLRPGGKIPNFAEVDLGKLLQSALGWEHALVSSVPMPWGGMSSELLIGMDELQQRRAWFWCAVHCARLVPYATETRIREWGITRSKEAINAARV